MMTNLWRTEWQPARVRNGEIGDAAVAYFSMDRIALGIILREAVLWLDITGP